MPQVYILLYDDTGRVLVGKKYKYWGTNFAPVPGVSKMLHGGGKYCYPGGRMESEDNGDPYEGALRELWEETGNKGDKKEKEEKEQFKLYMKRIIIRHKEIGYQENSYYVSFCMILQVNMNYILENSNTNITNHYTRDKELERVECYHLTTVLNTIFNGRRDLDTNWFVAPTRQVEEVSRLGQSSSSSSSSK